MSIASQLINKPQNVHHGSRGAAAGTETSRAWLCTEVLWMACTFMLFIILIFHCLGAIHRCTLFGFIFMCISKK